MRSALAAACICAAAMAGALWPWYPVPSVSFGRGASSLTATSSHAAGHVTVDAVPAAPSLVRFFEYDDPRYARGRGMSDRFAGGFVGQLEAALSYRGIVASVMRLDARMLATILSADPRGICVVVPGGILPDTVR